MYGSTLQEQMIALSIPAASSAWMLASTLSTNQQVTKKMEGRTYVLGQRGALGRVFWLQIIFFLLRRGCGGC